MSQTNGSCLSTRKGMLKSEYSDFQDAFFKEIVRPSQTKSGNLPRKDLPKERPNPRKRIKPTNLKQEIIEEVDLTVEQINNTDLFHRWKSVYTTPPPSSNITQTTIDLVQPEIKHESIYFNESKHWADFNIPEEETVQDEVKQNILKHGHEPSIEDEICNYVLYKHTLEPDSDTREKTPASTPRRKINTSGKNVKDNRAINHQTLPTCDYESSSQTKQMYGYNIAPGSELFERIPVYNETLRYLEPSLEVPTPSQKRRRMNYGQNEVKNTRGIRHQQPQTYYHSYELYNKTEQMHGHSTTVSASSTDKDVLVVELPQNLESSGYVPVAVNTVDNYVVTTLFNFSV